MRLLLVFSFAVAPSFAGTWFGTLVDSNCYESEQRNVNSKGKLTNVDSDQNLEIRMCSPKSKTKSLMLVAPSGQSWKLDLTADTKAADLILNAGHRNPLHVTVTGEMTNGAITVSSIIQAR